MTNVKISYNSVTSPMTFIVVAAAQGIPQKYGVSIEPTYVNATNGVAGLLNGDIQFQFAGGPAPIQAITSSAPIKMIANFDGTNGYSIFAHPSIATPADLKGKTIAVGNRGGNDDLTVRSAVSTYGLVVGQDVSELVVGPDAARLAALVNGNVDAAILSDGAYGGEAQAQGLYAVIDVDKQHIGWVGGGLVATTSFIQSNPNTILAVLKGLIDGVRYFRDPANRQQSIAGIAQVMNLPPDDPSLPNIYQTDSGEAGIYNLEDGVASLLGALQQLDPATYANVTVDQVVDTTFMTQLQSSGFVTTYNT